MKPASARNLLACFFIFVAFAVHAQIQKQPEHAFLPISNTEGKYIAILPDPLLGRDLLIVTRVAKGYADSRISILAGEKTSEQMVRFEKDGNKILLLAVKNILRSKDTLANGLKRSVVNSGQEPIAFVFDILPETDKSAVSRIDLTTFLEGENETIFMDQSAKENWELSAYEPDKSSILETHSYAASTMIKSRRTYSRKAGGNITVELGAGILLLSKEPMRPRYNDTRVGYYTTAESIDFDADPGGSKKIKMITRWRLEPKPQDIEKYKRGELVEPQKPIVFYIDPATPQKWVTYFIKGVSDWQAAFEKIGFKNAIYARSAPSKEEDPGWSLENPAYSNIVYMASDREDASYSTIVDPRSGEIIASHIRWYNDILKVMHRTYFTQASPNDPAARKPVVDDELSGALVRYIMSHEVGHALGFPHNFISSYSTPVALLRNKKWVEANGHTPSVMDYARFNYVAQPEDKIGPKGLFPRIGEYDQWAIEWGYRWLPAAMNNKQEKELLQQWIAAKTTDKRYWYGGEGLNDDPRSQSEDVGNDAMKANAYGIKNLKHILSKLAEWTKGAGEEFFKDRYSAVFYQFNTYLAHVADNVGGIYESPAPGLKEGILYEPVPKHIQQGALAFLNEHLFVTPAWLVSREILALTGDDPINKINELQSKILFSIMSAKRIGNLVKAAAADSVQAYRPLEYFQDLNRYIFKDGRSAIDPYQRNLQNVYIDFFERLLKLPANNRFRNPSQGDIPLFVTKAAGQIKQTITAALPQVKDATALLHLQQVITRLDKILNTK